MAKRQFKGSDLIVPRGKSETAHLSFTVDGVRHRRSLGVKFGPLAGEMALEAYRDAAMGKKPSHRPEIGLSEALERWRREVGRYQASDSNRVSHGRTLCRFLEPETKLSQIDDAAVATFIEQRLDEQPDLSGGTLNGQVAFLATVCERARHVWGFRVGEWDKTLHRLPESAPRERFLSRGEAKRLFDCLVPHAAYPVRLALYTGLRKQNILGLDWSNVSLSAKRATLIQKGGTKHTVALIDEAADLLREIEPEPSNRHGRVFVYGNPNIDCGCASCIWKAGQPIEDISRAFVRARERADLDGLRFHDLRHTVASWMVEQRYNLRFVQQVLGHKKIQTTMRYAHLEAGEVASAMESALSLREAS